MQPLHITEFSHDLKNSKATPFGIFYFGIARTGFLCVFRFVTTHYPNLTPATLFAAVGLSAAPHAVCLQERGDVLFLQSHKFPRGNAIFEVSSFSD